MSSSSKKAARRGRRGRRRRSGDDAQNPCRLAFAVALLRLRGARCCVARDAGVNCMEGTAGRGAAWRPYRPYSRQARRGATHPDGRQRGPAQRGARARERFLRLPAQQRFWCASIAACSFKRAAAQRSGRRILFAAVDRLYYIYFFGTFVSGKKKEAAVFLASIYPQQHAAVHARTRGVIRGRVHCVLQRCSC